MFIKSTNVVRSYIPTHDFILYRESLHCYTDLTILQIMLILLMLIDIFLPYRMCSTMLTLRRQRAYPRLSSETKMAFAIARCLAHRVNQFECGHIFIAQQRFYYFVSSRIPHLILNDDRHTQNNNNSNKHHENRTVTVHHKIRFYFFFFHFTHRTQPKNALARRPMRDGIKYIFNPIV